MSKGTTPWLMSTIRTAGLMFRMAPFIDPTRWSLVPKSVVSVMMGSAKKGLRFKRRSRKTERALRVLLLLQPIGGKLSCQGSVPEWLRHVGNARVSQSPRRFLELQNRRQDAGATQSP